MGPSIGGSEVNNGIPTRLILLRDHRRQRASDYEQTELKHFPFRQSLGREKP